MSCDDQDSAKVCNPAGNLAASPLTNRTRGHGSVTGVLISRFRPQSAAQAAGMQQGDVIIEYDGERNLETDRLEALIAMTGSKRIRPRVVFLRRGHEYSLTVPGGYLGISATNTSGQVPCEDSAALPGASPDLRIPWTDRDAWFVAALFFLLFHLVPAQAVVAGPGMTALLLALCWKRTGWNSFGFRRFDRDAAKLGGKLLLLLALINGANRVLLGLFLSTPHVEAPASYGHVPQLWAIVLGIAIVGPLTEEIIFRGIVFTGFRERYGWKTAAIISSILFALMHLQLDRLIPLFAFGYICAYLYQRTGSIWPGILVHSVNNALVVCAAIFSSPK